jgi:pimeloyl-ACP methyl ester carboxylesterase
MDMAAQADVIAKAAAALNLEKPLLVGHSLGGSVALALGLAHAQDLAGLALIAPLTLYQPLPPHFRFLAKQGAAARKFGSWTLAPLMTLLSFGAARRISFGPDPMPGDFAKRAGGALALRPRALEAAAREVPTQQDELNAMAPRYASMGLPVELLFGASDRTLDPKVQGEGFRARAPGALLTVIPGGHMLPITQADGCEKFLRDMIARL